MSVVVRMKMPKEGCHTCDARCVSALYGYICGIERKNVMPFLGKKNRPDWCPIICSLPEGHGRLIDASTRIYVMQVPVTVDNASWIVHALPTIVPAERKDNGETC